MRIHYNYITKKSPETKQMNLKYNCFQNHRNWSLEFSLCTQDTHETYVQCQSQNTAATGFQKQQYYSIS